MAQITGIKPSQPLSAWLLTLTPHAKAPAERPDTVRRPYNTGRRQGNSYTGIPGIAKRGNMFVVTAYAENKRYHVGCFVNLRTAIEILATVKSCLPYELKGVGLRMWMTLRNSEKYLPHSNGQSK